MEVLLSLFLIFCIFIIGSLFGSFYSLATYRLPLKQDIVATRSYCPNCKHRLEFLDLIPVLSFIFCGGKCRYCHDKISIRYFLLEVGHGILFVLIYQLLSVYFGYTIFTLTLFMVVAIIYSVIFVLIGSNIMKNKMKLENVNELEIDNLKFKKGVFLSELAIAAVLFIILLSTSFIIARNYRGKSNDTIIKSNAVSIGIKNAELALAIKYDNLNSFSNVETVDNIAYSTNVTVTKYSDENTLVDDYVKRINIIVKYNISGKDYEFSFDTLKGRV